MAMNPNSTQASDARSAYALWALIAAVMVLLFAYGTYRLYEPTHYTEAPPTATMTQ